MTTTKSSAGKGKVKKLKLKKETLKDMSLKGNEAKRIRGGGLVGFEPSVAPPRTCGAGVTCDACFRVL